MPSVPRALRFESFRVPDAAALETAVRETSVPAVHHDVQRVYVVDGPRARARVQVVHTNTRQEMLTVLDGMGSVLSSGRNDRDFVFRGYDFDYVTSSVQSVSTPIDTGVGQTTALDSHDAIAGKVNCPAGSTPNVQKYPSGFVVCFNDVLLDQDDDPPVLTQSLVAPRLDGDYTNIANQPPKFDPLGPQLVFTQNDYNATFGTSFVPHGNRGDLPALPATDATQLNLYRRITLNPAEQPVGPAHQAELQAFSNAGKQLRFYELLEPNITVPGLPPAPGEPPSSEQDFFRTTLTVHWRPLLTLEPGEMANSNFNNARAGRYVIKFADIRPKRGFVDEPFALELTSDGSVFAHEYHHHIQEFLAYLHGWDLISGDELFEQDDIDCVQDACRRVGILEGLADGFAAAQLNRGVIGTLATPNEPLTTQLAACNDKSAYGDGGVVTRALCNNSTFGYWEEIEPEQGDEDGCTRPTDPFSTDRFGPRRRHIVGGATYLYSKRFLENGTGPLVPARHMLEAERFLGETSDGEIEYFNGLLQYLSGSPFAGVRRYQYAARAAFAEKGVFPALVHQMTTSGSDPDERPKVECNVSTCNLFTEALPLALGALTMSGPFTWNSASQAPEFDLFAVPGDAYNQFPTPDGSVPVVWLEFSDNPAFDPNLGTFQRQLTGFVPDARTNCAPPGFFRRSPFASVWQTVANAALEGDGRVYYRVRQCLLDQGPDSGFCVVSTRSNAPAYVVVNPPGPGGGCQCRAGVGSTPSEAVLLLFAPLAMVARRWRRKR